MRINTLTFKNIRFNIYQYKAIFLSLSFGICFLHLFCSFYYNIELMTTIRPKVDLDTINMSLFMLVVFLFIFFIYAFKEFLDGRKKEFALYMSLGMTTSNLCRIIFIENTGIMLGAWIIGVISGTLFSRLFHLLIVNILNIKDILFQFSLLPYIITFALVILTFLITFVSAFIKISKQSITELRSEDVGYNNIKKQSPFLAIFSLLLIVLPIIVLSLTVRGYIKFKPYTAFIDMIITLIGFYLFLKYGGDFLLRVAKKNKKKYYNNLVYVQELNKRFYQLRKLIFVLSIGVLVVVYLIGLAIGLLVTVDDIANKRYPYDISYYLNNEDVAKYEKSLLAVVNKREGVIEDTKIIEALHLYEERYVDGSKRPFFDINVISEQSASTFFETEFDLRDNQAIYIISEEYTKGQLYHVGDIFTITNDVHSEVFKTVVADVIINKISNKHMWTVVVSDSFYNYLKKNGYGKELVYYSYNFTNLKYSNEVYVELVKKFELIKHEKINDVTNSSKLLNYQLPISKENIIENSYLNNKFFVFIMFYIAFIFFVISGVVLYIRVTNGVSRSKKSFEILDYLGADKDFIERTISKELKFIFIAPVILGGILSLAFTYSIYYSFLFLNKILLSMLFSIGFYLVIQLNFYLLAKKKYFKEIRKGIY